MSQNDLADDLYWSPCSRSVCGGMSAQIMWPQVDSYQFPCLFNNQSRSSIGYREDLGRMMLDLTEQTITAWREFRAEVIKQESHNSE